MHNAVVFTSLSGPEPEDLASAGRRFLAEGDSWFTLGTLNLRQGTNVLIELQFKQRNAVMSWAYPGDTLQHMVNGIDDRDFDRALWNRSGRSFASFWEGIILSAGGNDLIAAAEVPSVLKGKAVPPDRRLFLTAEEAAALPGPAGPLRRISDAGWNTLTGHLLTNFRVLLERKNQGPSQRSPVFLHTYATPAPRPSGAGRNSRGWLWPAMQGYGIDPLDMPALCTELFNRLRSFLLSLDTASGSPVALPQVHVFDSARLVDIHPARPGATGISGDWVNEIHLAASGYRKMGRVFGTFIDEVVDGYFGPL
jgi:hypothetical protein